MSYLKEKYTQSFIHENGLVMAKVVIGSYAFNLNTPKSDRDVYGIYNLTKEDFYSLHYRADKSYNAVVEKSSPYDDDITFMEIGKFFELLAVGNPNVLEMLAAFTDANNLDFLSPHIADIDINRILSKRCYKSFAEYASTQIKKARGLNKKINNPVEPERRTILDFCYLMQNGKTESLRQFLTRTGRDQLYCGVVALNNAKDSYALYYDLAAASLFGENVGFEEKTIAAKEFRKANGLPMGYGFKGIELVESESNEIRLSSVPNLNEIPEYQTYEIQFIGHMSYNKDGYMQHCKDHREYWEWVRKRNSERYQNNLKQNYDTKNISHCVRLLTVAKEIAEGKGIILRRTEDRDFLINIKLGNVEYDEAMEYAENISNSLQGLYNSSKLHDEADFEYLNNKLIATRRALYDKS